MNPITIGPMNCLNEDLNLKLKAMPTNVMVAQKISNSIDITSLNAERTAEINRKPLPAVSEHPLCIPPSESIRNVLGRDGDAYV